MASRGPCAEVNDTDSTMCVELIRERVHIETLCRRHGELLTNEVIIYKHLGYWAIGDAAPTLTKRHSLRARQADPENGLAKQEDIE
jgi:hypothetical protein